MLPIFLNDLRQNNRQDLVEVTLELEEDNSVVLCSVVPATTASTNSNANTTHKPPPSSSPGEMLGRSISAKSKLRQMFSWLRSISSRASSESGQPEQPLSVREAMKMKAKLVRTKSRAQRALDGLRFISKTIGALDANQLWRKVELRFESLAKDGLLSREDFGE